MRERSKVFAFYAKNFTFYSVFKHALIIIDQKFACKRCKDFALYAKSFTFYSILNTLDTSLIKNLRVQMQGLHFLHKEFYILQRFKHALPIIN